MYSLKLQDTKSMYKNQFCFYTLTSNYQKWQFKKRTILLTIASKEEKKKNLGINITKQVKDLYTENHKTLMKEIKDKIQWKNTLYS